VICLRPYQREAVDAVYRYLREHDDSPCVVLPTASGKTHVIATICRDAVGQWAGRILVLAHVKELLEQAADKLHQVAPELWHQIGVYSAGLGSRDKDKAIVVAGIQSVYRRAAELGHVDIAIVDESHLIPPEGDGMYRTLLVGLKEVNPRLRVVGLTATPFRMSSGPICGPENILNAVCYEVGVKELIVQGYLCPLVSKAGKEKADTGGLHVRAGEYIAAEVEALMDKSGLVESACREIVEHTSDRKSCLIFASGVEHARHVAATLEGMGQRCGTVFGESADADRDRLLAEFRSGSLKYLANVNVLTTGFDAPNIDCVALLRPTLSPGLYYQMVGRGFRLCEGKRNCLILDFGGNILRHGPVDAIRTHDPKTCSGGEAPAKECPQCQSVIHAGYAKCPDCGYAFPPREVPHEASAGSEGILSGQVTLTTHPVEGVTYTVHVKRDAPEDAPRSMRVEYQLGWSKYQSEWICFEHAGYARHKAEEWWKRRSKLPVPDSAEDAVFLANSGALAETKSITVRSVAGEKYAQVVGHELGEAPECPEPGWNDGEPVEGACATADDEIPF